MNERRLHPFTVLRFLRKTLVVYLLPLVQVLFERNWTALHTALRQDALLFLLLCAVSWGILRVSSWSMDDTGVFHLHWRLGIRLDRALRGEMLAALTIDRPLLYRMAGAAAGYRREGLWLREGRMTLRRQQGLYLHCICVFHPDVCLTAAQSPWAASVGRTNLTLTFPGWVKLKVRSVPLRDSEKFFRFMETN